MNENNILANNGSLKSTNLYGKKYYVTQHGSIVEIPQNYNNNFKTFGNNVYQHVVCSDGIKTFSWKTIADENNIRTINGHICNNNTEDSPIKNIETKDLQSTLLSDLDFNIDCGNHPITYLNIAERDDKTSTLQYSCGNIETSSNKHTSNISFVYNDPKYTDRYFINSNVISINCGSNVLTQIAHKNINGPVITYTCKQPITPASTPNILQQSEIFNTNKSNYIQELNIQTNNFDNPIFFWTNHKYTSTIPTSTTEYLTDTTINDDFFGVSCGKYGISGMTNKNGKIQYGCGKDTMYDLHIQEYNINRDPFLQKYYNSGVLFNKVKCSDNEVLSSFNRTITKDGPKIQWVCGKLL